MRAVLVIDGQVIGEVETSLDADGFRLAVEDALADATDRQILEGLSVQFTCEPEDPDKFQAFMRELCGPSLYTARQGVWDYPREYARRGKGDSKRNRKHRWG